MKTDKSAIEFPCYFPIKIIGVNSDHFEEEIKQIVSSYFPGEPKPQISCKQSKESNFLAITATVYVHDQPTLDALYKELTQHADVKMVL